MLITLIIIAIIILTVMMMMILFITMMKMLMMMILNLSTAFHVRPSILKTCLFNERNSNRSDVNSMRWNEIACNESLEKKLKGFKEMF